jgi:hypothetical protein
MTPRLCTLIVGVSGALAVAGVSACAAALSMQGSNNSQSSSFPENGEYGYPTGFLVAATIAGMAGMAMYNGWRRSAVMGLLLASLMVVWVLFLRCMIAMTNLRQPAWFLTYLWDRAIRGLEVVFVEGAMFGLAVGALVVMVAVATRRRMTWKLGLAVAVGLAVMGSWGVPWASGRMTTIALRLHWDDRVLGSNEVIRDAAAGGCIGALVGAVVTVMVASALDRVTRTAQAHEPDRDKTRALASNATPSPSGP